jgi:hypothetical protein
VILRSGARDVACGMCCIHDIGGTRYCLGEGEGGSGRTRLYSQSGDQPLPHGSGFRMVAGSNGAGLTKDEVYGKGPDAGQMGRA